MLGLGALAGHAVALVLDTTVKVSIAGLFIPGLVSYRPVWTSLGILAAELMVLVYASFSLRKRIGTKNWRRLHWATYGIFAAATVHGHRRGHRPAPALGVRALRRRRRLRRGRDDLAGPGLTNAGTRAPLSIDAESSLAASDG